MANLEIQRSRAVEDYAKAIHDLQGDGLEAAVGTNALAARLDVTPASASGMVRRLESLGVVEHTPYRGVRLTAGGKRIALSVIRRHRLLETFLSLRLGIPWDRVHAEAEVLEHVLSSELEAAIALDLGDPERDPHGAPIPRQDGTLPGGETIALLEVREGERVKFIRIPDERPDMLRWLAERAIAPGMTLEVLGSEPFGGAMRISANAAEHSFGSELAEAMRVERV
ncbi:MAG: metal-dependent transcriptional regulator [Actinobacteria bacterium]|uniref:Manganese transport regulator n=1 Tax=freshwater metagenome TaxID=449393 RepID=A0A6J7DJF1_9ZZZZ|nr:metal-dependent transcriptional regulator [Actinomycetota bacterium]